MRLRAHGLTVSTPQGWDANVYRRDADHPEEHTHPVMHAATFPLPSSRGDFGTGAVERMQHDDVLVALVEYDAESAQTALFARRGLPRPRAADFHPQGLQRVIPGQSGAQFFFNTGDRAFCLYVVLGSHTRRVRLMPHVHALLDGLTIH